MRIFSALWLVLFALAVTSPCCAIRARDDTATRHVVRSTAGAEQQRLYRQHQRTDWTPADADSRCSSLGSQAISSGRPAGQASSQGPLLAPKFFASPLPRGVDLGPKAAHWAGKCPALHPLLSSVFAPGSFPARRAAAALSLDPAGGSGAPAAATAHVAEAAAQRARRRERETAAVEPATQPQGLQPGQQQQQQPGGHAATAAAASQAAASGPSSDAARTADFDLPRARLVAQLQSIGYCSNPADIAAWNCTRCLNMPGFTPHLVHFDAAWDLMAYAGYHKGLDAKVVVFRGTDSSSWYNWAENMRAWRTDATYPVPGAPRALRIHSGFLILWNVSSLASTFTTAFGELLAAHPTGPTYIIGHSMGGALAHLCALDLKIKYQLTDLKLYTFGAPRVGNSVFADFFREHVSESWRFTHGRDIVPSVPIQLMGFRHVAREVWLVDVDQGFAEPAQRVVVCDDSGEDPTCHNSMCHLGLCTSVADHLTYLGVHMFAGNEC